VLAAAIMLTAGECPDSTGPVTEPEAIDFFYVFAQPANGGYLIRRSENGNCTPFVDDVFTMNQITTALRSAFRDQFINCALLWSMNTVQVAESRDSYAAHEARFTGGNNITVRHALITTPGANVPFRYVLETTGGAAVGQRTTVGTISVELAEPGGPEFRCSGGGANWDAPGALATFFELTLSRRDETRGIITGDFQCIARRVGDPSDTRVLLMMEGGFHLTAR
jgi:hypothetical protein